VDKTERQELVAIQVFQDLVARLAQADLADKMDNQE
jgi:hypothetical protein